MAGSMQLPTGRSWRWTRSIRHYIIFAPEEAYQRSEEKKLPLHVWTVNEEGTMRILAEQKIAALITNYPDVASVVVRETSKS